MNISTFVALMWVAPLTFIATMSIVLFVMALALRRPSFLIYTFALIVFGLCQVPLALNSLGLAHTQAGGGTAIGVETFPLLYLWFGATFLEVSTIRGAMLAVMACATLIFALVVTANVSLHEFRFFSMQVEAVVAFGLVTVLGITKARSDFQTARFLVVGSVGTGICWCLGTFVIEQMSTAQAGQNFGGWWLVPWHTVGLIWQTLFLFFSISDGVVAANRKALQVSKRYADAARRFVPDDFLRALGHADIAEVQLGDRVEREMAVLFSDIRSFTSLSETMSAGDTMTFVNEYLAHAGPIIRENGGFIDKYIGDAIMALFEDPDGALRAGLALQETLHKFNDVRVSHGEAPIAIGVGIHAGTLMLGTVGEERRIDTTVIADAVNVASRVEGLTKEYHVGIVVTDDLVKRLKAPPESLRPLGLLDEPILFFRATDGTVNAIADKCAHRGLPLSLGRLHGDIVECGRRTNRALPISFA